MPTFQRVIDRQERRWKTLKRGLDPEHQRALEALFHRARRHAGAVGDPGAADPFDAVLLTVLLELEVELQRVLARVAWLEADADATPAVAVRRAHPVEQENPTRPAHAEEDGVDEEPEEAEAAQAA